MDPRSLLAHLAIEGGRIAALPTDELITDVPTMPGWTVGRLIGHVGLVNHLARAGATGGTAEIDRSALPVPPEDDTVIDYYAASLTHALDGLAGLDPATPCMTWNGLETVSWWIRRLTQEVAMHRWDAENAIGDPTPIDPELAVDGIDELFELFTDARFDLDAFGPTDETIHLHATDIEGEWMATFTPDGVIWERAHGKGDVAVRGSASDLLLAFWSRRDLDGLEVFGDTSLIERWQAAANF